MSSPTRTRNSSVGMAVIGADLIGFPAGERHVVAGQSTKDLPHMVRGIEMLLFVQVEDVHVYSLPILEFQAHLYSVVT